MQGLLELRGLFKGGSYMRKYGSSTHQRSMEVQFDRYQNNILQEWFTVKNLSCVSCAAWNIFLKYSLPTSPCPHACRRAWLIKLQYGHWWCSHLICHSTEVWAGFEMRVNSSSLLTYFVVRQRWSSQARMLHVMTDRYLPRFS